MEQRTSRDDDSERETRPLRRANPGRTLGLAREAELPPSVAGGPAGPPAPQRLEDRAGAVAAPALEPADGDPPGDPGRRAAVALLAAVDLGVLADLLLRGNGPPALGFALWLLGAAGALAWVVGRERALSAEAKALVGGALLFSAFLVWRDSEALKVFDLMAIAALVGLAVYRGGRAWVRRCGVGDVAGAAVAAGLNGAFGAVLLASDVDWRGGAAATRGSRWSRVGLAALRGVVLALPVVLVLGALLMAADAVYERWVTDALRIDLEAVASHAFLIGFFAWISAGWLREALYGGRLPVEVGRVVRVRPRLGVVEVGVVLGLLNLLFVSFLVVQVRYFFGGSALVEVTPGLTYAEYARRGFFELAWVAALVLPLLLLADWLLERSRRADEWVFRGLAGLTVVLLFAIMASAMQRMRLYQEAFGLTELRLYTTAFMIWLAGVFLWFSATVLRGRRRRFTVGALVSALATLAALNVLNPDGLVVRTNAARAEAGASFDGAYAASLGAEAVPPLLAAWSHVAPQQRCAVWRTLEKRWGPKAPADWRNWNLGRTRARAALHEFPAPAACAE